jgi:signal transduction histidine kinase
MNEEPVRVLIIEDDPDDLILIESTLASADGAVFEVESVSTYGDGLQAALQCSHDVYLVDYRLGPGSGVDVVRAAIAGGCQAPMIVLTGHGAHDVDVDAMRAGAVDYLIKGEITARTMERAIRYAIDRKRVEMELAETQRRLAASPEKERLHLARELHDGPLQDLIGAWFQLGTLSDEVLDAEVEQRVTIVQDSLQSVIETLRGICGELRPPALAPFGLERAIRSHARRFERTHPPLDVILNLDRDGDRMPEEVRLALFRIYQTAMSNVAQHANARSVRVKLRLDGEVLRFEVSDNGAGFVVPDRWIHSAREGHLGLLGASERAEAIGGRLDVRSVPGEGTTIQVLAPLAALNVRDGESVEGHGHA